MNPAKAEGTPHAQNLAYWLDDLLHQFADDPAEEMRAYLSDGGPGSLILFGAGYQGELTLTDLRAMGLVSSVRCFIDNQASKWGQHVAGIPVCSPELLETLPKDARILISSGAYAPIRQQLAKAGFTSGVRILDVSALRNGLFDPEPIIGAREILGRLHSGLADDRSREVLESVLAFRLTGDIAHAERVCEPLHYFPKDVVRLDPDEVFIDGGAFDGDTIRTFLEACGGNFQTIHAFEPDPRNYGRLQRWVEEQPQRDRIRVHPQALYSHTTELCFDEGPSMSSHIDATGGTRIQAIGLDEFLRGEAATFIKYDLEGAEQEALQGAEATIRRWRPKLAISVYHLTDDLWTLPGVIMDMTPDYRYFLRHASFLSYETVFFAIPNEKCS